jgi:hypothetical protein
MINIDLAPIGGTFSLSGTYSWEDHTITPEQHRTAGFIATMKWDSNEPAPVVQEIVWVDLIPDNRRKEAETVITRELSSSMRTFSIIYQ